MLSAKPRLLILTVFFVLMVIFDKDLHAGRKYVGGDPGYDPIAEDENDAVYLGDHDEGEESWISL